MKRLSGSVRARRHTRALCCQIESAETAEELSFRRGQERIALSRCPARGFQRCSPAAGPRIAQRDGGSTELRRWAALPQRVVELEDAIPGCRVRMRGGDVDAASRPAGDRAWAIARRSSSRCSRPGDHRRSHRLRSCSWSGRGHRLRRCERRARPGTASGRAERALGPGGGRIRAQELGQPDRLGA
jgi:hypothetical protein